MPHGALPPAAHDRSDSSGHAPSPAPAAPNAHGAHAHESQGLARGSVAGGVPLHVRDYARTTLKPRHRPVVRALAEALFDHPDGVPAARMEGFAEEVDRFVSPASKTLRFGLLVMLDVIRLAPILVLGRFALFDELPLAARVTMLERMERSKIAPLTLILVAYKTIFTMLFFENETELAATGYPGPARERWRRLPIAESAAGDR